MSSFKLGKLIDMTEELNIDVLIVSSPENIYYSSGFLGFTGVTGIKRSGVIMVITREMYKEPALLYPFASVNDRLLTAKSWIKDRRPYSKYFLYVKENSLMPEIAKVEENPIKALLKLLKERNLTSGCIGIEEDHVTVDIFRTLRKELPKAKFKDISHVFSKLRAVKTKEEILKIKKATEATERALLAFLEIAEEGVSEIELDKEYIIALAREEGIGWNTRTIAAGVNTANPTHIPTNYKLGKGDLIKFDGGVYYHGFAGGVYQGYLSDIARTAVLGKTSSKQKKIYNAILRAQQKAIQSVKVGVKASEIFKVALKEMWKSGYRAYDRHYIGHGIGVQLTETPMIIRDNDEQLKAGMVLNVEVPYMIVGFGGFTVEDTIVVTEDGYEYLSTIDRELLRVG